MTDPKEPDSPDDSGGDEAAATGDRLPADHPVVKALAKANKEAQEARLRIKEYEDRDKTEQQRAVEKATELQAAVAAAEARAARMEVALEKGLTATQAKRLVGTTREELEADAIQLLADLGIGAKDTGKDAGNDGDGDGGDPANGSAPWGRPKEKLRAGAAGADSDDAFDPYKIADAIANKKRI